MKAEFPASVLTTALAKKSCTLELGFSDCAPLVAAAPLFIVIPSITAPALSVFWLSSLSRFRPVSLVSLAGVLLTWLSGLELGAELAASQAVLSESERSNFSLIFCLRSPISFLPALGVP